jgi:hypothetical protein
MLQQSSALAGYVQVNDFDERLYRQFAQGLGKQQSFRVGHDGSLKRGKLAPAGKSFAQPSQLFTVTVNAKQRGTRFEDGFDETDAETIGGAKQQHRRFDGRRNFFDNRHGNQ